MTLTQATPAAPAKLTAPAKAQLAALVDGIPATGYPGTTVGVVNSAGEVQFLGAAGPRDVETGESAQVDTVYWVASVTKLVTSIAALQLVEAGKVGLDEPLSEIAPELAARDLLVKTTETDFELTNASTPITLRHLLTHTAGFAYGFFNKDLDNWIKQTGAPAVTPLKAPLVHEPGTKFEYGINIDWAGIVVERLSGKKLGEYFSDHIFAPLGIKDATFDLSSRPDLAARLATLHAKTPEGYVKIAYPDEIAKPAFDSGGAGLYITAGEYLKLLAALLNGGESKATGERILKPDTLAEALRPQTDKLPANGLGWLAKDGAIRSTNPGLSNDIPLLPGVAKAWSLGGLVNVDKLDNGRSAGATEWVCWGRKQAADPQYGIANLFWALDPTAGVAAVAFSEVLPLGREYADGLGQRASADDVAPVPGFFDTVTKLQDIIFAPGALSAE
ncbi:Acyltransferase LovD [Vanrija pseudolonga]|uniref:Acyltransferase LovD n=1 Tax=Vanrija pseudolonga TaxID=143232 RepID=A0AAF1BKX1_9TREE|nr:Acyltransferase LovD [Vanrija pseudolonga]